MLISLTNCVICLSSLLSRRNGFVSRSRRSNSSSDRKQQLEKAQHGKRAQHREKKADRIDLVPFPELPLRSWKELSVLKAVGLGVGQLQLARVGLAVFLNDSRHLGEEPIEPVEVGHRTASVCHLGNIAMQLKRKLRWDPQAERFLDDDEANRMLRRPYREPWSL